MKFISYWKNQIFASFCNSSNKWNLGLTKHLQARTSFFVGTIVTHDGTPQIIRIIVSKSKAIFIISGRINDTTQLLVSGILALGEGRITCRGIFFIKVIMGGTQQMHHLVYKTIISSGTLPINDNIHPIWINNGMAFVT